MWFPYTDDLANYKLVYCVGCWPEVDVTIQTLVATRSVLLVL